MDLMHNETFRVVGGELEGVYRIILDEPGVGMTALVQLNPPPTDRKSNGGRKRLDNPKNPRKKPRPPNIGKITWVYRSTLEDLIENRRLIFVEVENSSVIPNYSDRQQALYDRRVKAMAPFLSVDTLRHHLTPDHGVGQLVKIASEKSALSKSNIYKLFSILCRYGFSAKSLHLDFDKCGAPNVSRPCDPGGRKKAGAKTIKQKLAQHQGITLEPEQPGMNSDWEAHILAADSSIPTPKPAMPDRVIKITESAFFKRYRQDSNGELTLIDPGLGSYPNRRQIQRVLEKNIPKLERLIQRTTERHFERSMRGLRGKSWKGVAGPGHTWAIDSTVGDMYLRSSINRAWIIGRPIVYVIVDEWSTAVVGFYVCLRGPSWDMAKLSLFCSGADPSLVGSLWGYEPILSLDPAPTLCANLLCDRGEYLSKNAKATGIKLLSCLSYTPPYRPELKGLVEVLHRIEKDKQYHFVPGAIDARRKEFDLRRFNPEEAVFTVKDFVHWLHAIFSRYNLTANREHRLDAHMKAVGVIPTPAGLWSWGHKVGIGTRRAVSFSDLVTELLPNANATVTKNFVTFGKRDYQSDFVEQQQWTAYARNFGGWKIPANYFPGSVSTIWTPDVEKPGLLELNISDQSTASPELTWDEVLDADAYYSIGNAEREHQNTMIKVTSQKHIDGLVENAKRLTQEAIERDSGSRPTLTEARQFESAYEQPGEPTPMCDAPTTEDQLDEAETAYLDAMSALFDTDLEENQNA